MSSVPARRSDARQNRERLISAARELFAGDDVVALEAIAERAGVGIGTLYRHFPKREALVEAVYRNQVEELRVAARALLETFSPAVALRAWMDLFARWAVVKRGMVQTIAAMRQSGQMDFDASRREIEAIIASLLEAGVAAGELRGDVDPADLRSMLAGTLTAAEGPEQAGRLFDLTMDALRRAPTPDPQP